jgi:hypothetical protein
MSQQELLKRVVHALNEAGIEYMVTGSLVSSIQGEPRLTHDIDLLVMIKKTEVQRLIRAFPPEDFYFDEDSINDAIDRQSMFNIIDIKEGDKIDFWLLTGEAFDRSRFNRRYSVKFLGTVIFVSSPEDTILAKLRWAKMSGGSQKQFGDALRVYEVQYGKLEPAYLEEWASRLDITDLWESLKKEADVL